ncbi:MAG TPA: ABC transporter permease [Bryobacteraceae bacterium]|jgi:putative ABC transport system permease protein|nr:ABC transporter permease [Bryobacteraceae bacterium]
MDWLLQDARFGFRTLFKDRAFVITAVLALALGIGSTTAIFSVIDNVLLEPFPYTDQHRLISVQIHDSTQSGQFGRGAFSPPEFLDYQQQNQVFDSSIGVYQTRMLRTGQGAPESWNAAHVTGNTFEFLGVRPLLGRYATPGDAKPGAPPVFVMSYKLWQKRFSGDPAIIGKTFTLDDTPRTLIGIMPKRFAWWGSDVWVPAWVDHGETNPNAYFFFFLGHLKPGLTLKSARPDLTILAQRLSKVYPKLYPKKFDVQLVTLADNVVGRFRETLFTLLAAVGLLLLIACANVANLLLAKATVREKEFAIRNSLGAGRVRIIRQLLVESLVLALSGAAVGCLLAWGGLAALKAALPVFTFPDEAVISLNARVLAATVLVAVFTALLFGMAPAFGSFSRNLSEPLKAGGRGNSGFRRGRMRNILIVCEVALSLILLSGAGLMMRSFFIERYADLGLSPERLVVTDIALGKKYQTADQQERFLRELTTRLRNAPGVVSATGALDFPPFGGVNTEFEVGGKTHAEKWSGQMGFVDAAFFRTLGMRQLRGRFLTEEDVQSKRKVVVVNETLAKKYFPGEDPIGKQIELARLTDAPIPVPNPWFEIVGVSSDVKNHGVSEAVIPEAYAPVTITAFGEYVVYLRARGNPAPLAKMLEGEVLNQDKSVRPQQTMTLEDALNQFQYAQPRFGLEIFSVFAAVGLILVTVGVYSVVSYTVSQQSREIGIRMALGASTSNVLRQVMGGGMRFILIGVGVGLVAAFLLLRLMKSQISGISTYDPLTLAGVVALLAVVGLGACYLPSLRATRVDPTISLRYE